MNKTTQIIEVMEPQENKFDMAFDEGTTFYKHQGLNPFFFQTKTTEYVVDTFVIYDPRTGEIFKEINRGWFDGTRYSSNNRYETLGFLKDGEQQEPKRKIKMPELKGNKEVFFMSKGKDKSWTGRINAIVYFPITYLMNKGYQITEYSTFSDMGTITTERRLTHPDLTIFLDMKTTKNFVVAKKVFMDALAKTTNAEELKAVIDNYKFTF